MNFQPKPEAETLLSVKDLQVSFRTDEGLITPVNGVSFDVKKGKTLGIVGESGSGKSVSTRALMRLLPKNAIIDPQSRMNLQQNDGSILDIAGLKANSRAIRQIRGGIMSMIFQEPMASFSPVYTIGNQIGEAVRLHRGSSRGSMAATGKIGARISENLRVHQKIGKQEAKDIAVEMLDRVGISNAALRATQYPHELSGGMRQRAMIAVALSTRPQILIADEPTTALDVTIQAQILELVRDLQQELGMAVIFITHDMGVIARVADEVAVMYLGRIVEQGPTESLIRDPKHPYTRGLMEAIPRMDRLEARLKPVPGDIPGPMSRPSGCAFHPRCSHFKPGVCDRIQPKAVDMGDGRQVACLQYEGVLA